MSNEKPVELTESEKGALWTWWSADFPAPSVLCETVATIIAAREAALAAKVADVEATTTTELTAYSPGQCCTDYCVPELGMHDEEEETTNLALAHVKAREAAARREAEAEVANAFVAWGMKNETAAPPLDWKWFGEIARRYSPLHEELNAEETP